MNISKQTLFKFFLLWMVFTSFIGCNSVKDDEIFDFKVSFITNIDNQPIFSWKYKLGNETLEYDQFELIVADNENDIEKSIGNIKTFKQEQLSAQLHASITDNLNAMYLYSINFSYGSNTANLMALDAGVVPLEDTPCFKHFELKPYMTQQLQYAKVSYNSGFGEIRSHWKNTDEHFIWKFEIPANSSATVYVPNFGKKVSISINGEVIEAKTIVENLLHLAVLKLGSIHS